MTRAQSEAYRRRVQELREERRQLAAGQGEQLALPIADAKVVRLPVRSPRRRRGWVAS